LLLFQIKIGNLLMKRIGLFTSGGDAPGMNACIRSVVRTAHHHEVEVVGIMEGYCGMLKKQFKELQNIDVAGIINRGGSILRASRCREFREKESRELAYNNLREAGIDGLVAIGGNGTFTGAYHFEKEFGMPTIGVPGTIDNDLYGTDYTIGFDTACNTAMTAIDAIRDTASSHNRLFIVEVMGRDAGFIAVNSCVASGGEAVMLPEDEQDLPQLMEYLDEKRKKKIFGSIVVIAEGDQVGGAMELDQIIKEKYPQYDTRVTILGHVQRGGIPTCSDRILASRLGMHATEALIRGEKNKAVGVINDEVVFNSFDDSIHHAKSIHPDLLKMSHILVS
jgi:6-phosphofructokinase 1